MHDITIVLGLFAAVAALVPVANRLQVPYPILLVIGGLLLSFVPGLPRITLAPDLVFLVFLPPLLYWDSVGTSWRDFQANLRPISTLAVGLVVFTTCGVAVVAHMVVHGLSWPLAFVLGAIVSSTDAVAASSIATHLGLPVRIVAILEGESLMNDASSLVVYATALTAVTDGSFSLPLAVGRFVLVSVGGIAIGLAAGYVIGILRSRMEDPLTENTVSLLTPFVAYIPAEQVGVSGILAVVACGLYIGRLSADIVSSRTRLQTTSVWSLFTFLLNGLAFILVGLQLHGTLSDLGTISYSLLLRDMALVSAAVIVVRIVWVFAAAHLPPMLRGSPRADEETPWQETAVLAWAGMRGVVALATALSLPAVAAGRPFPQRELLIALTFAVILTTLVLQGLTLPVLIRRLGIENDGSELQEETQARLEAASAALAYLTRLMEREPKEDRTMAGLREMYVKRIGHLTAHIDGTEEQWHDKAPPRSSRDTRRELIEIEHRTLVRMRNSGEISDEVMRRIERELDLDEVRLDTGLHAANPGRGGERGGGAAVRRE